MKASINLKALREQKHLTQEELSEASGISIRTIQRVEAGQLPKGHTARVLAKALDVELDSLQNSDLAADDWDYSLIKIINLSSAFVTFIPLLNIILPLAIMHFRKQYNSITKQIVSLQILWTIVSTLIFFLTAFFKISLSLPRRITLWVMIALIVANVVLILVNAASIDRNKRLFFVLPFKFF